MYDAFDPYDPEAVAVERQRVREQGQAALAPPQKIHCVHIWEKSPGRAR